MKAILSIAVYLALVLALGVVMALTARQSEENAEDDF